MIVLRALATSFFLIFAFSNSFGQGYLMLAGGAGESQGGWSDTPYKWVVDHAANKRIAVISYSSGQTEWIPDYFKSFGAVSNRLMILLSAMTLYFLKAATNMSITIFTREPKPLRLLNLFTNMGAFFPALQPVQPFFLPLYLRLR
jgi:hypothetical protein